MIMDMKKFLGKSIFKATGWTYNVDPAILEKLLNAFVSHLFSIQNLKMIIQNLMMVQIGSIWLFGKVQESTCRIIEDHRRMVFKTIETL